MAKHSSEFIDAKLPAQPLFHRLRPDLIGQRLALVAVVMGIWWLSSLSVPHYILPGPARVWDALRLIVANGDLWNNLGITLWRVAVGFIVAALIGLPFGIVLGANKRAGEFFDQMVGPVAVPVNFHDGQVLYLPIPLQYATGSHRLHLKAPTSSVR